MNKQIEEMAKVLYENRPYKDLWEEDAIEIAKVLYNAGYRKQIEGEWIPSPDGIKPIRCNKCHMPAPFMSCDDDFGGFGFYRYPWKFCPNCGARMRGGKE